MNSELTVLMGITAVNALASVVVALWARQEFDSAGKLRITTAICLGIVFYIHMAVSLATAWSGVDRGSVPLSAGWRLAIGLCCVGAGVALIAAGRLTFGHRARVYGLREDELLTHGIYAWSRNPQYFGTFLVLLGTGLIASSIITLFLAGAFLFLIHVYIVLVEEPHLSKTFGKRYSEYRSATSRYIGISADKQT